MRTPRFASERSISGRAVAVAAVALAAALASCRLFIDLDGITGDAPVGDLEAGPDTGPGPGPDPTEGGPLRDAKPDQLTSDADAGPAVSLDGSILLLHMDESAWSGARSVIDSSGQNNHGTPMGTMAVASNGKFGNAGSFDGKSWIAVSDAVSLHVTDKLTVSAWIYPTVLSQGTFDNGLPSPGVVNKREAYGMNVAFTLYVSNGDRLWLDINSNARNMSTTQLFAQRWYHVAMVYDGTAGPTVRERLFVNGELSGPFAADAVIAPNTQDLLVGNLNNGGDPFVGLIDEVAVWSRALSDDEIQRLFQAAGPLR